VSLIFPPGSFFAAHRSFLPRTPTFKIAAGAFVAGALVATVASNAPKRSSPADTAAQNVAVSVQKAAAVEAKSTGAAEKAKPAKRPDIAAKPSPIAPESRDVAEAARPAALPEPVTLSDALSATPVETDANVGLAAREAMPTPREVVPSPRAKPHALIARNAKEPAAQEATAPASRGNPDALAALIAKLNAADAAGAPAPETVELPSAEAPAEIPSATPAAPEVNAAAAKPSEAKPAESKPIEAKPSEAKPIAATAAAAARPAVVKRVAAKRVARHEDPGNKPLNLADVRALQPMRSLVQSRNHADGFTLVRSRTLPDGRRVTVWQRPAAEPPRSSSPLLAFGSLFGGRY
jgi:hypothetical protein